MTNSSYGRTILDRLDALEKSHANNGNGWSSVGKVLGVCLVIIGVPTAFVWSEIFSRSKDMENRIRVIESDHARWEERMNWMEKKRNP